MKCKKKPESFFLSILLSLSIYMPVFYECQAGENELSSEERWLGWQLLFDGKSLNGWKVSENAQSFKVIEGKMHIQGERGHLFYTGNDEKVEFKNFIFRAMVKTEPGANGGIYFHSRFQEEGWPKSGYEVQINQTHKDRSKTGSLYGVVDLEISRVKDGDWFELEIVVLDDQITIRVDNHTVVSYREPEHRPPSKWPGRKLGSGTFALQAHDPKSAVYLKDIKVLPRFDSRSEKVSASQAREWSYKMDMGPFLHHTIELGGRHVLKGLAVKCGPFEDHMVLYDTETMQFVGAWNGTLDMRGVQWRGVGKSKKDFPIATGKTVVMNQPSPGWAKNGILKDPRDEEGGPLPDDWLKYKGVYKKNNRVVMHYSVGQTEVYESPDHQHPQDVGFFSRFITIPHVREGMVLVLADEKHAKVRAYKQGAINEKRLAHGMLSVLVYFAPEGAEIIRDQEKRVLLFIPENSRNVFLKIYYSKDLDAGRLHQLNAFHQSLDLRKECGGGLPDWPETLTLKKPESIQDEENSYQVEELPIPSQNPWSAKFKSGGFDFFSDGDQAALCTWNGDVWVVSGLLKAEELVWRRVAAGLYDCLGLKIVDDQIYVTGRDQITKLHDLNNDGEADFYECFNNDVKITNNFHEFMFDLQTDDKGRFYFSKAAPVLLGGRGFSKTTQHHGTLMRLNKDGSHLEVISTGMRAPGGIGIGPMGEMTTGENEGSFIPHCKINWCKPGSFHGVIPSEWNGMNFAGFLPGGKMRMDPPLCWLPMEVDNSGGSQVWVNHSKWGLPKNTLLHCSYGKSAVYRVMMQDVNGVMQGGVVKMPFQLSSSAMRARFNPVDHQLYVVGFKGWQTNAVQECAFQKVKFTGRQIYLPEALQIQDNGLRIRFASKLNRELAEDVDSYAISIWNYLWSPMYGSGEFSVLHPNIQKMRESYVKESKMHRQRDQLKVLSAKLMDDHRTVELELNVMRPVHQMQIDLDLESEDGHEIFYSIYNTINVLKGEMAPYEMRKDAVMLKQ